ncbi:ABC transporter permease [Paenibacillus chartarius]|uniref:ABC transporter permease n=1 Tax=Paenibacillus chartarius TaxID=747481 RepID=A0ABV6DU99_9BACL
MSTNISRDMFQPAEKSGSAQQINKQSLSYWQDIWRRLKKNKLAIASIYLIVLLIIMAIIGPFLLPYSYSEQSFKDVNLSMSAAHWFGTDDLGRDLFVRVWYGARYTLLIGFTAAFIDLVIGVIYGSIAGLAGGRTDTIMMRIVEIFYSIPYLLVVIMLMVLMGPGLKSIIIALGAFGWMGMARLVRGQILLLKEQEFVLAATTLGASKTRLIFKHLIPNALSVIIVNITFTIPHAIFAEAFLSFLGLGIPVPKASLGTLTSDAVGALIQGHAYQLFFPAALISIAMLAFNLLGDGLRDALDPKMRK